VKRTELTLAWARYSPLYALLSHRDSIRSVGTQSSGNFVGTLAPDSRSNSWAHDPQMRIPRARNRRFAGNSALNLSSPFEDCLPHFFFRKKGNLNHLG
jgi:hypothetical protein